MHFKTGTPHLVWTIMCQWSNLQHAEGISFEGSFACQYVLLAAFMDIGT